jgi:hypothetical protein
MVDDPAVFGYRQGWRVLPDNRNSSFAKLILRLLQTGLIVPVSTVISDREGQRDGLHNQTRLFGQLPFASPPFGFARHL